MKLAAKIMLSITYAAQFGTTGFALLSKPRHCQLEVDKKNRDSGKEVATSKLKNITNVCTWLDD